MKHYWQNMAKVREPPRTPNPLQSKDPYATYRWTRTGAGCAAHADCGFSQFCGAVSYSKLDPPEPIVEILPADYHGQCMSCHTCEVCAAGIDNTCGGCHELSKPKNAGFPSKIHPDSCKAIMKFVPCGAACRGGFTLEPIAASETTECVATGFNSHVNQATKDAVCNRRCHDIKKCRLFRPDCSKCSHQCICNDPTIATRVQKEAEPAHPHTIGTGKWTNGPVRMLQDAQEVQKERPTINV